MLFRSPERDPASRLSFDEPEHPRAVFGHAVDELRGRGTAGGLHRRLLRRLHHRRLLLLLLRDELGTTAHAGTEETRRRGHAWRRAEPCDQLESAARSSRRKPAAAEVEDAPGGGAMPIGGGWKNWGGGGPPCWKCGGGPWPKCIGAPGWKPWPWGGPPNCCGGPPNCWGGPPIGPPAKRTEDSSGGSARATAAVGTARRTWRRHTHAHPRSTHAGWRIREWPPGRWAARLVHLGDLVDEVLRLVVAQRCGGRKSVSLYRHTNRQRARTSVVVPHVGEVIATSVVGAADWATERSAAAGTVARERLTGRRVVC